MSEYDIRAVAVEERRAVLDMLIERIEIAGGRRPVAERVTVKWKA